MGMVKGWVVRDGDVRGWGVIDGDGEGGEGWEMGMVRGWGGNRWEW